MWSRTTWFCRLFPRSFLFLRKVALSWAWRAYMFLFSFVGYFIFYFVSYYARFVLFLLFVVFLLYFLLHHLHGRVHGSDPMGVHGSDSTVGPGYFSSTRRGFLCFSFDLFRCIHFLLCCCSLYNSCSFVCLFTFPISFFSFIYLLCFFFLSFLSLSVYRGNWRMYVVPVYAIQAIDSVPHSKLDFYLICLPSVNIIPWRFMPQNQGASKLQSSDGVGPSLGRTALTGWTQKTKKVPPVVALALRWGWYTPHS